MQTELVVVEELVEVAAGVGEINVEGLEVDFLEDFGGEFAEGVVWVDWRGWVGWVGDEVVGGV